MTSKKPASHRDEELERVVIDVPAVGRVMASAIHNFLQHGNVDESTSLQRSLVADLQDALAKARTAGLL